MVEKHYRIEWRFLGNVVLLLIVLVVLGALVLFMFPPIGPRAALPEASRANNLKQIANAIQKYEADRGWLPPPYLVADDQEHRASWRVLLLPHLGENAAYYHYDFKQPWNSKHNLSPFIDVGVPTLRSPGRGSANPVATDFVAVVGRGTAWPRDKRIKSSEFADVASNLILLVEIVDSDIHCMEPRDLNIEDCIDRNGKPRDRRLLKRRLAGCVLFADGDVWELGEDCPEEEIAKFFTMEGARKYDRKKVLGEYVTYPSVLGEH